MAPLERLDEDPVLPPSRPEGEMVVVVEDAVLVGVVVVVVTVPLGLFMSFQTWFCDKQTALYRSIGATV
ncbi:hypothetical protein K457DRAFT_141579 [Linnemannia elongata AG-77]|uniref:Uncharacterized protein n=1 Tax=Linnemannia elongata AG-77 TaxID=1314771 RepID=A0A197JKK0_9FUNG|nr:hypothetical protein K457DRAFT_141579 [Linnemannia elongata AG-77]